MTAHFVGLLSYFIGICSIWIWRQKTKGLVEN